MISKNYIDYIYNKCYIEKIDAPRNTILIIEMPNRYVFSVSGVDEENAVFIAKSKITELEEYLYSDAKHYGYEFEGEYE